MLMRGVVPVIALLLAPFVQSAYVGNVGRQADCEQFGTYPEYKGPCTVTSKLALKVVVEGMVLMRCRLWCWAVKLLEAGTCYGELRWLSSDR